MRGNSSFIPKSHPKLVSCRLDFSTVKIYFPLNALIDRKYKKDNLF